jgi:RNA polymerase sigma factor (sigma-70 family)
VQTIGFHELYQKHSRDVYRFAVYLTGDVTLAEDVTSETFVRVWSSAEPVRLATVKAYLLTIARNLCQMEYRRTSKARMLDESAPDLARNAAEIAEARDELDLVLRALRDFPEADRAALLMRAEAGLSYEEIAAALGLPVATVKVKVHRTRLKLAQIRIEGVIAK